LLSDIRAAPIFPCEDFAMKPTRRWLRISFQKRLFRMTLQGVALVLPLIITVWVIWWLANGAERLFAEPLKALIGVAPTEEFPNPGPGWLGVKSIYYLPGMGIALGLVLTVVAGLAARVLLVKSLVAWSETIIGRIPLVKTLYGGVRDLLGFMGNKRRTFSRVVLVTLPGGRIRTLGLVTRESFDDIAGLGQVKGLVAVYIPGSYLLGGVMLLVPPEDLEPIDMRVQDALRFAMTAGISVQEGTEEEAAATAAKNPGKKK
jgi:uncharacterized membrane protein